MTTEQEILWLLFNRSDLATEIFATIKPDMFYTPEHGRIYSKFYTQDFGIDDSDFEWIWPIQNSGTQWIPWIPKVMKERLRSEFRENGVGGVFDGALAKIREGREYRNDLDRLAEIEDSFEHGQKTIADLRDKLKQDYIEEQANPGSTKGFKTGCAKIDEATDRLKKGHLWVIAGYTSFGKTTLAMQFAREAIKGGAKVDFISLEMSAEQLFRKMAWLEACGMGNPRQYYREGLDAIATLPLTITEKARDIKTIEAHIKSNPSKADIFIVDYIQLVGGGDTFFESATLVSNLLQGLAITQDVHILALSQITKESAKTGGSFVMDFKNSGAIGESADVAIEINRQKDNESVLATTVLFIKKNRHGKTGKIDCEFDTDNGYFILNGGGKKDDPPF